MKRLVGDSCPQPGAGDPRRSSCDRMRCALTRMLRAGIRAGFFLFMVLGGAVAGGLTEVEEAEAASFLTIRDDASGGDCTAAGIWDPASKTCRLTSDSRLLIVIASDGVTLDGGGHALTGDGPVDPAGWASGREGSGDAVDLTGRSGVTVKDLRLAGHHYGVNLHNSHNNTITGITTSYDTGAGISLSYSTYNTITGNVVTNPADDTGICVGFASSNNIITENNVSGFARGIFMHDASNHNDISGNTLNGDDWGLTFTAASMGNRAEGNSVSGGFYGIYVSGASNGSVITGNDIDGNSRGARLEASWNNIVTGNNFLGNAVQAEVGGGSASFADPLPGGGNYWDDFDEDAEGCADAGGDGFCDAARAFAGGSDPFPRIAPVTWPCVTPALVTSVRGSHWDSYADYRARELSVKFVIENVGTADAFAVELDAAACDKGCYPVSELPAAVADTLPGGAGSGPLLIRYHVPDEISAFRVELELSGTDACGSIHRYPFEPHS